MPVAPVHSARAIRHRHDLPSRRRPSPARAVRDPSTASPEKAMNRTIARALALGAAACLAPGAARAVPLQIVQVSAPQVNCVFNTSCTVTVNDFTAPLWGAGFLQSRTYQAAPGSPAAGMWVYEYRIDLTRVVGTTAIPQVTTFSIDFGPVVNSLDFNGDGGSRDQVFVVTGGGLGSVGPVSAD